MLWLPIVVGLLAAALALVLVAYAPRMGYALREPTEAERERIHQLLDDVDAPSVDVEIRATHREGTVECDLLGLPGRRTLIVTDGALEHLDDESLRALVAVEAERGRARIQLPQALSSGVAIGIIAAPYVLPVPVLPAFILGWSIVLVAILLVRRRYYTADRQAGDLVGLETLRDAMERAAERRGDSLETGPAWRVLFDVEPSVGARLERLEDQTGTKG